MIHALHGNFGLPSDWDAALPPGVPAKAWHLWEIRRHHPEARTLTGFATWFNNQIEALPPDPHRILAGYSLGGRLALHVLIDRPHLWHRSLIISAHPGLKEKSEREVRLKSDQDWKERCLNVPWVEVDFLWNSQPVLQTSPHNQNFAATGAWRREIAMGFVDWSLGQQENLAIKLASFPFQGRWLTGALDQKFVTIARTTAEKLSGCQCLTIAASGHRLLLEQPGIIQSALLEFMD